MYVRCTRAARPVSMNQSKLFELSDTISRVLQSHALTTSEAAMVLTLALAEVLRRSGLEGQMNLDLVLEALCEAVLPDEARKPPAGSS